MKLFIVKIEDEKYKEVFELLSEKLDETELKTVNQFRFDKGKATKVISLLLKKYVIRNVFGLKEYTFEINKYGKPYIKNDDKCFFNISHSENYVICGVSDVELGVDIEKIKPCRNILEIAKRFYSCKEFGFLNSIPVEDLQLKKFYEIWTKKESFIKAVGQGVSLGLDTFSIPLCSDIQPRINFFNAKWYFMSSEQIDPLFPLAVCEKGKTTSKIEVITLGINEL